MPLLSIVIPVYNVENYIKECIDSILNQSFKDFELLIVNDGSTDNSPTIIENYQNKDNRIKIIHQSNSGASSARNTGLKKARGKYIYFIDSDDYLTNSKVFEKINFVIEENVEVDVVKVKQKAFKDGTRGYYNVYKYKNISIVDGLNGIQAMLELCRTNQFVISVYSYIIKRELLIKNKIYFLEGLYSEDIDWTPRVFINAKKIKTLDEDCYYRRQDRPGQVTFKTNLKRDLDCAEIINSWFEKKDTIKILDSNNNAVYFWDYLSSIFVGLVGNNYLYEKDEAKIRIEKLSKYSYIIDYHIRGSKSYLSKIKNVFGFSTYVRVISITKRSYRQFKKVPFL